MSSAGFSNARVLLAEPNTDLRSDLSRSLEELGFKHIIKTGNLAGVYNSLKEDDVDLLVGDTVLPEGNLTEIIRDIRHLNIADTPFMVIIALITHPSPQNVQNAVNCGADDVLLKPFTAEDLSNRVKKIAETRKKFVVTTDYIGPDRRTKARTDAMQVPLIKVPNPLQMRVGSQTRREDMKRANDIVYATVNEQKVERYIYQLAWLSERFAPHLQGKDTLDRETVSNYLRGLSKLAKDLEKRIHTTRFKHHAALGMTLSSVAKKAAEAGPENREHWHLLERVIHSLPKACSLIGNTTEDTAG